MFYYFVLTLLPGIAYFIPELKESERMFNNTTADNWGVCPWQANTPSSLSLTSNKVLLTANLLS